MKDLIPLCLPLFNKYMPMFFTTCSICFYSIQLFKNLSSHVQNTGFVLQMWRFVNWTFYFFKFWFWVTCSYLKFGINVFTSCEPWTHLKTWPYNLNWGRSHMKTDVHIYSPQYLCCFYSFLNKTIACLYNK